MPGTHPTAASGRRNSYISPMRCNTDPSRIPMASSAHHARWIRKEVAMTAITLNTAHQSEYIRQKLGTALTALHDMLDSFVSNRMQKAAAEAERARSRRLRDVRTPSI